jgi:hypothetical protein
MDNKWCGGCGVKSLHYTCLQSITYEKIAAVSNQKNQPRL